jgi:hypothetical protein
MGLGGVLVGLHRMFVGGFVITVGMILGCRVVGLRCVLVMLCCLLVCVVCHEITFFERYELHRKPYAPSNSTASHILLRFGYIWETFPHSPERQILPWNT